MTATVTSSAGGLRGDTVEVTFAAWLVERLLDGLIVLDWQIQRRLGGRGQAALVRAGRSRGDFVEPACRARPERLDVEVDADFYRGAEPPGDP